MLLLIDQKEFTMFEALLTSNKTLYPDPLDTEFLISLTPEAAISAPDVYVFLVRDWETGELLTPESGNDWLAEYPSSSSPLFLSGTWDLTPDNTIVVPLNIVELLSRSTKKEGYFLLSAHIYDSAENVYKEREQSQLIYIFKNGLKPPNLP